MDVSLRILGAMGVIFVCVLVVLLFAQVARLRLLRCEERELVRSRHEHDRAARTLRELEQEALLRAEADARGQWARRDREAAMARHPAGKQREPVARLVVEDVLSSAQEARLKAKFLRVLTEQGDES